MDKNQLFPTTVLNFDREDFRVPGQILQWMDPRGAEHNSRRR